MCDDDDAYCDELQGDQRFMFVDYRGKIVRSKRRVKRTSVGRNSKDSRSIHSAEFDQDWAEKLNKDNAAMIKWRRKIHD